MTTIHVACAVEGAYDAHSAAMLHSVLAHAPARDVEVHYLHGPRFPARSLRRIAAMVARSGATFSPHEIGPERVDGLPVRPEFTAAMWYRIFLPELVPGGERALYLDVDTLILDDLAPLWQIDLGDHYLAAVTNVFQPEHRDRPCSLGLAGPEVYFNSGVLLLNLEAMRRDGATEAMRGYATEQGGRIEWPDQDTLNVVLGARRLALHPRWNAMNSLRFPWSEEVFGPAAVAEARRHPAIRHFEGPDDNKPWHPRCDRDDRRLYFAHLRRTPWRTSVALSPVMQLTHTAPARARRVAGRWRRRARALRAARGLEPRLVWVLGSPRSGSTWLLQLLSEHEGVVPVNEPNIGQYLGPFLSDLPGWDATALHAGNFTLRKVEADKPAQFFASEFRDVWLPSLRRMMLQRFAAHVAHYPARGAAPDRAIVVIKEPNGSQSADLIMGSMPQSRLLFLLRDGRDVIDSELAANLRGAWVSREFPGGGGISEDDRLTFVKQSAAKWLWRTEVVQQAFAEHPGPKLQLRYEDLRADPERHVRDVLAWCGLDVDDEQLRAMIERHSFERVPAERRGPQAFHRAATPGYWRENLTAGEQGAIDEVIGAKLRELGYDAVSA